MSDLTVTRSSVVIEDKGVLSPWWFRFGLIIVGIDIALQTILIWQWNTVTGASGNMMVAYEVMFAVFVMAPGTLIALPLTAKAISNLRRRGKVLVTVIFCLAVWTGPVLFLIAL